MLNYQNIYKNFFETDILSALPEKEIKEIKKFKRLDIQSIFELLYYFPRGYDSRTCIKSIKELVDNEYTVVKGSVASITPNTSFNGSKKMVKARVVLKNHTAVGAWAFHILAHHEHLARSRGMLGAQPRNQA